MTLANIILDLCIVAIAGITIYVAYKRGFVKTFISAVSSILAMLMVMIFTVPLANAMANTAIAQSVREKTAAFVDGLVENSEEGVSGALELVQNGTSELNAALESVGISLGEFSVWTEEHAAQGEEAFRESLVEYISGPATTLVMRAIAMLVLYFGTLIVLKIVSSLLSGVIERLPLLRQANHALGIVLGAVMAVVYVFIFCAVVGILVNTSSLTGLTFFDQIVPEKTILYRWFDAIQILGYLF